MSTWPIIALPDDAVTEVSAYINDCWQHAYAGILDPVFLANLTTEDRAERIRRKLDDGAEILVIRDDTAQLAGITLFGPSHLPGYATAGLVGMLYVRPDLIHTGLGHRLLQAAEAALATRGYTQFVLDVFSANTTAIEFYRRHGYEKTGEKQDLIEGNVYRLDIMAKPTHTP